VVCTSRCPTPLACASFVETEYQIDLDYPLSSASALAGFSQTTANALERR